jgi:hypothetical protein
MTTPKNTVNTLTAAGYGAETTGGMLFRCQVARYRRLP